MNGVKENPSFRPLGLKVPSRYIHFASSFRSSWFRLPFLWPNLTCVTPQHLKLSSSLLWYWHKCRAIEVSSPRCTVLISQKFLYRLAYIQFWATTWSYIHYVFRLTIYELSQFIGSSVNSLILGKNLQKEHVPHGKEPRVGEFSPYVYQFGNCCGPIDLLSSGLVYKLNTGVLEVPLWVPHQPIEWANVSVKSELHL